MIPNHVRVVLLCIDSIHCTMIRIGGIMDYSHNFGSNFPIELIPVGDKKDIDDTVKSLIIAYNSYISAGDLTSANELYDSNKTMLEPYSINMKLINRLEEEIYNTSLYALNQVKNIISDTEPANQSVNSFWYQDY